MKNILMKKDMFNKIVILSDSKADSQVASDPTLPEQ